MKEADDVHVMLQGPTRIRALAAFVAGVGLLASAPAAGDTDAGARTHASYDLLVRLDPEHRTMHVEGTMTIPPPVPRPLRVALGNPFGKPALHVASTRTTSGAPLPLRPAWHDDDAAAWDVAPEALPDPAQPLTLWFSYDGGEKPARIFAIAPDESYADGSAAPWYPQVRASAREADVPNVVGTIRYEYPRSKTLVSSGTHDATVTEPAAAGAPSTASAVYRIARPQPLSFALGTFTLESDENRTPVALYFLHERADAAQRFIWARQVVDRYERWYGPFPHAGWRMVEIPTFAWGNDACDLAPFSTSLVDDWNAANFAHELSHPYWGGDYLANEGLATFAALETIEASEGPAAAERFRRTDAPGYFENASGLGYLRIAAAGYDVPLAVPAGENGPAQNIAFGKGSLVFDMLARSLGRDRFHAFLRTFFAQQRAEEFANFSWPAFFSALSRASGRDMTWFYNQWFVRPGAPEWTFTWHNENRTVVGEVVQMGEPYAFDLPLEARDRDGHVYTTSLHTAVSRAALRWELPATAVEVRDDPHYTILHWTPEYRALATALAPFVKYGYKPYDGVETDLAASLAGAAPGDPYGVRFSVHYALARLAQRKNDWSGAKSRLEAALREPVKRPEAVPWVYLNLARADGALNDAAGARAALRNALAEAQRAHDGAAASRARRELASLP